MTMRALGLPVLRCCTDRTLVFSKRICEDRTTNSAKDFNTFYLKYSNSYFFFLKAKYVLKNNYVMPKQELILETLIYSCNLDLGFIPGFLSKPS